MINCFTTDISKQTLLSGIMANETNSLLWTTVIDEDTGETIAHPPEATPNIHITGRLTVGKKFYLTKLPAEGEIEPSGEKISMQERLNSLSNAMADFESGQELESRLAAMNAALAEHQIGPMIELYTLGAMDELSEQFQYEQYRNIVVALSLLEYTHSAGYTENLDNLISLISGMYKASILYRAHQAEVHTLEHEIQRLNAIINGTTKPPVMTITSALGIVAEIPPEITIYIEQYGMPEGGVFEPEKLWEILATIETSS